MWRGGWGICLIVMRGVVFAFSRFDSGGVWGRRLGDEMEVLDAGGNGCEVDACLILKALPGGKVKKEKGTNEDASAATTDNKRDGSNPKKDTSSNSTALKGPKGLKGARSSYIFFTNAQRPQMLSEYPGMRFTEHGVIMGKQWRTLLPKEKKPYKELATRDKEWYSKEMGGYIESVKQEIADEKKLAKDSGAMMKMEVVKDGMTEVKKE